MTDRNTHVYDKAKYHLETIDEAGLPESHASNHIVPIVRWLIDNDLMSDFFLSEGSEPLARYRAGEITIHELFEWWDTSLVGEMLSERGNAFAMAYFDYDNGKYIQDYIATLQGNLPSEFHVSYSEAGYTKLREVIDSQFAQWSSPTARPWWQFWR